MHEPTNAELQASFDRHSEDDREFQDSQRQANGEQAAFKAETEGSLADLHKKLENVATKEDISDIVSAAISSFFEEKGKISFKFIVGTSILVGALIVIFGGIKTALGWLGFHLIK